MSPAHDRPADLLEQALASRDDWLGRALSTEPADRPAAEAAITGLYRLLGAPPPRFVWVPSPGAAIGHLDDDRIDVRNLPPRGDGPLPVRLADRMMELRHRLRDRIVRRPNRQGLQRRGDPRVALDDVLDRALGEAVRATVHENVGGPLRAVFAQAGGSFTWYGQHDAAWLTAFDVRRRLGLLRTSPGEDAELDLWAAVARSCGWWWPRDGTCVVAERPVEVHTEPVPGSELGVLRLHHGDGFAVRYSDGWGVHAWHGTRVPDWVMTDPTPERIRQAVNVEVRRCAIERIGWDVYIDQAGLTLVSTASDPGNPGCELRLYSLPPSLLAAPSRVLLAVNGSVERDGHRRRYGLGVPGDIDDPVAAAGWSYGLTASQYARLQRRT
ncbi:hypothetical protein BTM25_09560 [Actinomadura rubteroloni]|uniref:DUF6745 domain-containing protein n=1 Tax=Actinomadura rubteroloni TaxID=1926885 RepID=A0A2P4UNE0_9ACTN|nr:hypothetical protein [Actinomadura rubteroloni]POM26555.1 hypothetical protein BTM25_09560 [Actinomadura rubteroloni]